MTIEKKAPTPSEIKTSPQPFTEQELSEIKDLRREINTTTFQYGQLHINKLKIDEGEINLRKQIVSLELKEENLAKKLSDKYGNGSIDIDTGTFIPSK